MSNIELKITRNDWLGILVVGLLFSGFLSLLGYFLLTLSWIDGALFGVILGFFISLYSLVFISAMNRYLLPNTPKNWWDAIAIFFSFLSGFLGSFSTYFVLHQAGIGMVEMFESHLVQSSSLIGILTYLIGALIYRFVKARNEKEHLDTLFIQSRVSSLETQLNPHFLFNALNSLAELIHQDPHKAEAAVLKISTFLRNTMAEKPLITLRDELRNVHDYIDLENIRFGGIIALDIDAQEEILTTFIPKFSIQLLCENAIKHGMINTTRPFTITISAKQTDRFVISVSNNGRPITNTKLGIGLSNLQERLAHLCQGELRIHNTHIPTFHIILKECHEHLDR